MIALGIETSPRRGSVALAIDDRIVDEILLEPERGAARLLAPGIDELLRRHSLEPAALDLLVVGLGPGGYTGARLAAATGKALAFALQKPLLGVASTSAMAIDPRVPVGRCVLAIDAKKDVVYLSIVERNGSAGIQVILPPTVAPAAELVAEITPTDFIAGDGLPILQKFAGRPLAGDATIEARASHVLSLGLTRFHAGERDDERMLLPLYLRPSEAERLWALRHPKANS